jgi:hypothetical protein
MGRSTTKNPIGGRIRRRELADRDPIAREVSDTLDRDGPRAALRKHSEQR